MWDYHSSDLLFSQGREEGQKLSSWIGTQKYRVYSPSYSLPYQTAAGLGLELADGIDPMILSGYSDFAGRAMDIDAGGYSVTMPPFPSGDPKIDLASSKPDAYLLGLLNVKYVVSAFELSNSGDYLFKERTSNAYIYENPRVFPRAWIQSTLDLIDPGQVKEVEIEAWSPNEIKIHTRDSGYLILSEIQYPGWQVYIDGKPEPTIIWSDIFRSVLLDGGDHQVIFRFSPQTLKIGLTIFIIGVIISGYLCLRRYAIEL